MAVAVAVVRVPLLVSMLNLAWSQCVGASLLRPHQARVAVAVAAAAVVVVVVVVVMMKSM